MLPSRSSRPHGFSAPFSFVVLRCVTLQKKYSTPSFVAVERSDAPERKIATRQVTVHCGLLRPYEHREWKRPPIRKTRHPAFRRPSHRSRSRGYALTASELQNVFLAGQPERSMRTPSLNQPPEHYITCVKLHIDAKVHISA